MTTARMTFSGQGLERVRRAIDWTIDELRGQIGSCPDVALYEDELDALEKEIKVLERMRSRIDRKLTLASLPKG